MECPICQDNIENGRRLPCHSKHIFCGKCLKRFARFLKIKAGSQFYCPLCQTQIVWPKNGIKSFDRIKESKSHSNPIKDINNKNKFKDNPDNINYKLEKNKKTTNTNNVNMTKYNQKRNNYGNRNSIDEEIEYNEDFIENGREERLYRSKDHLTFFTGLLNDFKGLFR